MEVARDSEFAPVKNAPGSSSDSPDTARHAILSLHQRSALVGAKWAEFFSTSSLGEVLRLQNSDQAIAPLDR